MTTVIVEPQYIDTDGRWRGRVCTIALSAYILLLAWAPFPLGGAVSWGSGLQVLLLAGCWGLWALSVWGQPGEFLPHARALAIPLALCLLVLFWAFVQTLPIVPANWAHPLWAMASGVLNEPMAATISIDPWRTDAQILKLSGYLAACGLAFLFGQRVEFASRLLNAIIVIGVLYALYAIALAFADVSQPQILYAIPMRTGLISGPFMLHNSFATYSGLATLAAVARLFEQGSPSIVADRGFRRLVLTVVQFTFGRGAPMVIAVLLTFGAVIASGSRAGFAATICGLFVLTLTSLLIRTRGPSRTWAMVGACIALAPLLLLVIANGDALGDRFSQLLDSGTADTIRLALWAASQRMIAGSPWLGLGLGTFQDAYPLYATKVFAFVMDKAHCDYLEFAAGIGLPAAIAWWCAMAWAFGLCLRGVRNRGRHRVYSLVAVGATALVAVHSSVDFSLQLPAVGLSYATLMGLGLAQAFSSRAT